ncbi:FimB/Mfa2 family fimbrial subunit [Bacteroides sp.]|uniref:FimB/Mfa2 family fimbrial subunit n=1 Tax=Bacteroides sp. TaxID=29523 RepID=UPI00260DCEF8|nr:FimB/Mfa2 family fimbrial subunit [Bacteroides sp.]MDD3036938.1 FimB/Mfa2 family fimbrial subunit [Bacteroides sp.]
MKKILYILSIICLLTGLNSCHKDVHDGERGIAIALTNPNRDAATDLRVWIYDNAGNQIDEYRYGTYAEIANSLLDFPTGDYTVVVATNIIEPFRVEKLNTGATDLENLFVKLTNASASPAHAHYGTQKITVKPTGITHVAITLNRVLAEMNLTFNNVPDEVLHVTAVVTNCADGFYPGLGKLSSNTATATIGEKISPQKGVLTFPMVKLMPIIAPTIRSGEAKTLIALTFHYSNGGMITFNIEAPVLQNGGTYNPVVEYSILRSGITIELNDINGWVELPPIGGEILNPIN